MKNKTHNSKLTVFIRILTGYFMAGIIYSQTHIMTLVVMGKSLTLIDQLFALVMPLVIMLCIGVWVKQYNMFTLFEISSKYTLVLNIAILAAFQLGFRELIITSLAYALMMSCVPIAFTLLLYLYRSVLHANRT